LSNFFLYFFIFVNLKKNFPVFVIHSATPFKNKNEKAISISKSWLTLDLFLAKSIWAIGEM
ncbi:MAG: hypothetical protein K2Y28_06025, partial [Burkholderiaceae bacterium]|nr:hypothetical protein [Burkholderiaceae bacterium]